MLFIFGESVWFLVSVFMMTFIQAETSEASSFFVLLLRLGLPWLFCTILTQKFQPKFYQQKLRYVIAPYIRSGILYILLVLVVSWITGHGPIGFYLMAAVILVAGELLIVCSGLFLYRGSKSDSHQIKRYEQTDLGFERSSIRIPDPFNGITKDNQSFLLREDFQNLISGLPIELGESGKVFSGGKVLASLLSADKESIDLMISDIRINDIRHINKHLISCYDRIKAWGVLIAGYTELADFEEFYLSKYPRFFRWAGIIFYYFYFRAFPKIPFFNKLYFTLSGGKKRVLSRAEVWGRLFYCGFDVINELPCKQLTYLIARKVKTRSENPSPSYYPLVRLNRVGYNGKIIKIHKIRSMYPYSEFLQKKMYERDGLNSIGKFNQDFRITKPGKFYRRYWIDELPQIYDWLRGEIKLVGIRALSQQFFSLYPTDYQELFTKIKPGIFSPIFDENDSNFNDIVNIETEYMNRYLKNPLRTDFIYFFITLKHIIKGVRSK